MTSHVEHDIENFIANLEKYQLIHSKFIEDYIDRDLVVINALKKSLKDALSANHITDFSRGFFDNMLLDLIEHDESSYGSEGLTFAEDNYLYD